MATMFKFELWQIWNYDKSPWAIFTKLGAGRVSQAGCLYAKLHGCGFTVVDIFRYKLAKKANLWEKSLSDFLNTKFGLKRESRFRTLMPNFTVVV